MELAPAEKSINAKGLEEVGKLNVEFQAAHNELDRLATFILTEYEDEPGRTGVYESPVDVAIRLLSERK